jgi:uncharacterized protein (DUF2147 family)
LRRSIKQGLSRDEEAALRFWLVVFFATLIAAVRPAFAQAPTGEWLVADGTAQIRVVDCAGSLWGVVSWEKSPGRDVNNPDPAKRERPTLGMPVLLQMRVGDEPGVWEGHVYNADNGRTYTASIRLSSPTVLHVEGCALGFLCGGEDWTRAEPRDTAPARQPAQAICAQLQ